MYDNSISDVGSEVEAVYVCASLVRSLSDRPALAACPELKGLADTASKALRDLYRATVLHLPASDLPLNSLAN